MAKWDLSKLPEGRKPLPDEWFAERAQMQERIKELEDKLAEYKHVASAIDTQWAESQDEIADLKAKLARAVRAMTKVDEARENWNKNQDMETFRDLGAALVSNHETLAELTGGKNAK